MSRNTKHEDGEGSGAAAESGRRLEGELSAGTPKGAHETHALPREPLINFRKYQEIVFLDRTTGVLILHWSRQIGKSFTLAVWAVDRLLTRPGRLVTVLSNSKMNGAEFIGKCREVTDKLGLACEIVDESPDIEFVNMRIEVRIKVQGKEGRIIVLAANPRTARGFSGDLIMDEFAFHENSAAIWEAAEPILSSNPDFLCRIASTGNGKHNMFYRMVAGPKRLSTEGNEENKDGSAGASPHLTGTSPHPTLYRTEAGYTLSRVTRTEAWQMGVKVYDPISRKPISPDAARLRSLDKRAYDQNYECVFTDENMVLLTHELISAAEVENIGEVCVQDWTPAALHRLRTAIGPLYVGVDIGRHRDWTVITVIEKLGPMKFVRGLLRIEAMRLPDQQKRLGEVFRMTKFSRGCFDMTGLGLGLFEYSQDEFGASRIQGINFASSVPTTNRIKLEGRRQESVRVTEALATELLQAYEDRSLKHPIDSVLRDDLRKPEKITSPGGRVSIAATRDEAGHADHFWSFALAVEAASSGEGSGEWERVNESSQKAATGALRKGAMWL